MPHGRGHVQLGRRGGLRRRPLQSVPLRQPATADLHKEAVPRDDESSRSSHVTTLNDLGSQLQNTNVTGTDKILKVVDFLVVVQLFQGLTRTKIS